MKQHIAHFENLPIERPAGFEKIFQVLTNAKNVTVKYDGAPAFGVFRNVEEKLTVVTKANVLKVYDGQIINPSDDPDKDRKFMKIWKSMKDVPLQVGFTYYGDYVGSDDDYFVKTHDRILYQPNVLIYNFPNTGHELVVLIHTILPNSPDANPSIATYACLKSDKVNFISSSVSVSNHNFPIDVFMKIKYYQTLNLPEEVLRRVDKTYNAILRAGQSATYDRVYEWLTEPGSSEIPYLREACDMFSFLSDLKMECINIFEKNNRYDIGVSVMTSKGEVQKTRHEGYVVEFGDSEVVKFVDRNEFSRINFSDNYLRGWKKPIGR